MRTLTALAVCLAMPAVAQEQCGGFADMAAALASQWGESQQFVGIDTRGLVNVLFLNPETLTWTALVVDATGKACVVASGERGQMVGEP